MNKNNIMMLVLLPVITSNHDESKPIINVIDIIINISIIFIINNNYKNTAAGVTTTCVRRYLQSYTTVVGLTAYECSPLSVSLEPDANVENVGPCTVSRDPPCLVHSEFSAF